MVWDILGRHRLSPQGLNLRYETKVTDSLHRNPSKMSYMLPHLDSGYAVDQAILSEEDRVVVIRFGHDWDPVGSLHIHGLYELRFS